MADPCSVMIVDDEREVARLYALMLRKHSAYEVLLPVLSGELAVEQYVALAPDVVLMDLNMPGIGGIEATRKIRDIDSSALVIALTSLGDRQSVVGALRAGAVGYLLKTDPPEQVIRGIEQARADDMPLSPGVLKSLLASEVWGAPRVQVTRVDESLLGLLAQGLTNAEIAAALFLSEGTVKQYLHRLMSRFDCSNRTQLVLEAYKQGLVGL